MPTVKFGPGSASSFASIAGAIDTIAFDSTIAKVTSKVIKMTSDAGDTIIRGTGFSVTTIADETFLTGGNIKRVTFDAPGEDVSQIKILNVGLSVPDLFAAISAESSGADTSALENLFLGLDWRYLGSDTADVLPDGAMSVDGVPFNLIGNDVIKLFGGDDVFFSGDGNDRVYGGAGNDDLAGGAGKDKLYGGIGEDELAGGSGNNRLEGDAGNDVLYGGEERDKLFGGTDDDILDGGLGRDRVDGGTGNDMLDGGADNDKLIGGDNDDVLDGGTGNDKMFGGDGNDTFVFVDGDGTNKVKDFGLGDIIDLSGVASFTTEIKSRGVVFEYEGGSTILLGVDEVPVDLIL